MNGREQAPKMKIISNQIKEVPAMYKKGWAYRLHKFKIFQTGFFPSFFATGSPDNCEKLGGTKESSGSSVVSITLCFPIEQFSPILILRRMTFPQSNTWVKMKLPLKS